MSVRRLIVGLGNIGEAYVATRHNIGFALCNLFCGEYINKLQAEPVFDGFSEKKHFKGSYFETHIEFQQDGLLGLDLVDQVSERARTKTKNEGVPYPQVQASFLLPGTLMNRSGNAVRCFYDSKKFSLKSPSVIGPRDEILVIHDDISIPFGHIQLSPKGSSGGHNGVNDIIRRLGTEKFVRLRIGILPTNGVSCHDSELVHHVLGKWTGKEKDAMPYILHYASEVLRVYMFRGFQAAAGMANGKDCETEWRRIHPTAQFSYNDIKQYM